MQGPGRDIIRIFFCRSPCIGEILDKISLLVGTENKVNSVYLRYCLSFELGITTCNDNERSRMLSYHTVNCLSAFVVGYLGYGTGVYQTYIGFLSFFCRANAHILKKTAKCGSFREVQFAA